MRQRIRERLEKLRAAQRVLGLNGATVYITVKPHGGGDSVRLAFSRQMSVNPVRSALREALAIEEEHLREKASRD